MQSQTIPNIVSQNKWKNTRNLSLLKTIQKKNSASAGGKLIGVFLNVDLRCNHSGLADIAKKKNVAVEDLKKGQILVFMNSSKDKMKLFFANNFIGYYKSKNGKIDLSIIRYLPNTVFNINGEIDIETGVEKALSIHLAKRLKQVSQ